MSVSSHNNSNGNNENNIIWIGALAIVLVIMVYFYANQYLKYPAYYLMKYTYYFVSSYPFLGTYLSESYTQDLVKEWSQARYVIPEKKALDHINVSLPFYLPLIGIYFILSLHRFMRYTIPYTYRYKIASFDKLVTIKSSEYPQIISGYLYGKEMVKNPELQKFGTYSAEYGPIRYLISIGVIKYMGSTLFFKQKPVTNGELEVPDDPKELSVYAKSLDIDLNKLYITLYESLGKKISSTDDLTDAQIALANVFLIFSTGQKNKLKAQARIKSLALAFKVKNPDGQKENKKLNINRKKELNSLNKLLNKIDDKLIFNSEYQMEFLLSCYAYAKANGADISPPDFLWLKALERKTYLLLHTYSGDPDIIKNNSYIEVIAPMNRWLDMYRIFSIDASQNKSNKEQIFELNEDWAKILSHQISVLNSNSEHDSFSLIINKEVSNLKGSNSIKSDLYKSKSLSKILKKYKSNILIEENIKYRTFKEMLLAQLISILDRSHSSRIEKEQCLNYINKFKWLISVDRTMFNNICFIFIVKANTENIYNKISIKKNGLKSDKDSHSLIKNIIGFDLIVEQDKILYLSSSNQNENHNSLLLSELYVNCSSFVDFQSTKVFSSAEYKSLSMASFNSLDQSVTTILYYLTNFEVWLHPKYKVELYEFLGGKLGE